VRLAASICALSACLFFGSAGGGIAWADTESAGSGAQSQGADSPSADVGSAGTPANKVANPFRTTLQATVQGVTSALRSIVKLSPPQMNFQGQAAKKPAATNTQSNATDTESSNDGSGPTAADPSPTAADPNKVASDQPVVASESTEVPPATNPPAPVSTVFEPMTNALATAVNVFASVPGALIALPTSPTPITDAITLIQEMVTSVTHVAVTVVVTLAQVSSDLLTMLSGPTVTATSTFGGGVEPDATEPLLGTWASEQDQVAPTFLAGGMALPADIAPLATLGHIATTGLRNELPVSGIASPAHNAIVQSGLGSFLEHTIRALFVPASLSALAAVALPGVGGLLIVCALGVRVGYRQAKALFEVRRAGIACFAGPGPLGVVRSGSLIALRPRVSGVRPDRALRIVRPNTSRAACLQDDAA
jgi:hypothetical protein